MRADPQHHSCGIQWDLSGQMICFLYRMQDRRWPGRIFQASNQPVEIRKKGQVVPAGAKVPPGAQSQALNGGATPN
jgi:hypothetical protein